ncbi:MAG: inorganic phosphate transporter [Bacillota bacterium]
MHESTLLVTIAIVILALSFDFVNGFHDTANAIATSISTGALKPRSGIILASVMNLAGALSFTGVAETVGGRIINPLMLDDGLMVVMSALLAAITWNLITWYFGLPSSSSHALIGSLTGSAVISAGYSAVNLKGYGEILKALLFSPVVAFIAGLFLMSLIKALILFGSRYSLNTQFRRLQVAAATFQAFAHGTNDAQKTMGIIVLALITGGYLDSHSVPLWVKLSSASAMALGTSMGGWKIIRTVGTQITRVAPPNGFASDLSSALIIITATLFKLPVSTTHVISSSIMGAGTANGISAVNWGTAKKIIMAWLVTLPASAVLAALSFVLLTRPG